MTNQAGRLVKYRERESMSRAMRRAKMPFLRAALGRGLADEYVGKPSRQPCAARLFSLRILGSVPRADFRTRTGDISLLSKTGCLVMGGGS